MENTFVLKIGGTSVGTTERIKNIADQLIARKTKRTQSCSRSFCHGKINR